MEKEYLIQKWLDHNLNAEELEAFKKLEDYESLMKLSHGLDNFKAPNFDESQLFNSISEHIESKKQSQNWLKPMLRIAAILIVALGSFWFLNKSSDITTTALASQKITIELPDASQVSINASSELAYNTKDWNTHRAVKLEGEAFFKVAKGSTFDVKTSEGIVTVLGTQFNVKQRDNYFEVICYEGLVGVSYHNQQQEELKPGQRFLVIDGKVITKSNVSNNQPDWILNESQFESMSYKRVLSEFERQYNVNFDTTDIDLNQLFTGNFAHDNYHVAIQSITLPLRLTYSKNNDTITLKSE